MGHAHSHSHAEGEENYFLDQLFTILVCGALGLVAILMYLTGMLGRMLVPMFFVPVLLGGLAVLLFVAIRAAAVWRQASARTHESAHHGCAHDHAHGDEMNLPHDHSWAPWRYMVVVIPVFLYFLDLPRAGGLSIPQQKGADELAHRPERQSLAVLAGGAALTSALRKTEPRRLTLRFHELSEAAASSRRDLYDSDIGIIRGQYLPLRNSDREFALFRWKKTCCDADAIPLKARIEAPEPIQGIRERQWVRVEGLISFRKDDKGHWVPVITLTSSDSITPIEPPGNNSDGY